MLLSVMYLYTYRAYVKQLSLRSQIELLKALNGITPPATTTAATAASNCDSEISDEVDQGLISLVDKSTYSSTITTAEAKKRKSYHTFSSPIFHYIRKFIYKSLFTISLSLAEATSLRRHR